MAGAPSTHRRMSVRDQRELGDALVEVSRAAARLTEALNQAIALTHKRQRSRLSAYRRNVGDIALYARLHSERQGRGNARLIEDRRYSQVKKLPVLRESMFVPIEARKKRPKSSLTNVIRRLDRYCHYCSAVKRYSPATTVDHIVPLSRGGTNRATNLLGCCDVCQQAKGSYLLSELQWPVTIPVRLVPYKKKIG